jgi:hypothetical protein
MSKAREMAEIISTPPSIYSTDAEVAATYLTQSSASTTYLSQENNRVAFKNLIINGKMEVAQRATSAASLTGIGYNTADRWRTVIGTQGTWTQSVENDAPTGSGFTKSLKMLCTTADASPAAGDFLNIQTRLEGQNVQHIKKGTSAAEQLTLSFWVKSNVTGTYIANLGDATNTRGVSTAYTILTSATWEKKTITFAADTIGAFSNDNLPSLDIIFWLGAGTDYTSGTLNTTWASVTSANRAVGQVNLASAISNYWQVTGVQLEIGTASTPFEHRPTWTTELQMCQRYYEKTWPHDSAIGSDNTGCAIVNGGPDQVSITYWMCPWRYQVEKRANPTVTLYAMNGTAGSVTKWSGGTTSVTNSGLNTNWQGSTRQVVVLYNQAGTSGIVYNAVAAIEL